MRVIIAGSRNFDPARVDDCVDQACAVWEQKFSCRITEVVSGHRGNVDLAGEWWSERHLVRKATRFPFPKQAELLALGIQSPNAGEPIHHGRMAKYVRSGPFSPGGLVVLWSEPTRGTAAMLAAGERFGLLVHEHRVPARPRLRLVGAGFDPLQVHAQQALDLEGDCSGCPDPLCPDCAESPRAWGGQS